MGGIGLNFQRYHPQCALHVRALITAMPSLDALFDHCTLDSIWLILILLARYVGEHVQSGYHVVAQGFVNDVDQDVVDYAKLALAQ